MSAARLSGVGGVMVYVCAYREKRVRERERGGGERESERGKEYREGEREGARA